MARDSSIKFLLLVFTMFRRLFALCVEPLLTKVKLRIMQVVDDSSMTGSKNGPIKSAINRRDNALFQRYRRIAASDIVNSYPQLVSQVNGGINEPRAAASWFSGTELGYVIPVGTGENARLGDNILMRKISFRGSVTPYGLTSGFGLPPNGAFARVVVAHGQGLVDYVGGGSTAKFEQLFRTLPTGLGTLSALNQLMLATRDDDPRFQVLYDSGIIPVGGLAPLTVPVSFEVDCNFEKRWVPLYSTPQDVVVGQVHIFLMGCQVGERDQNNNGSSTYSMVLDGVANLEFQNLQ